MPQRGRLSQQDPSAIPEERSSQILMPWVLTLSVWYIKRASYPSISFITLHERQRPQSRKISFHFLFFFRDCFAIFRYLEIRLPVNGLECSPPCHPERQRRISASSC